MAKITATKCVYLALHILVVSTQVSSYKKYTMEREDICHPLGREQTINLSDALNTAAVVQPDRMLTRRIEKDILCKFVFKASRHTQLFVVIQVLELRRRGSKCLDYVQFKADGKESVPFCGMPGDNLADHETQDSDEVDLDVVPHEFNSTKGKIETRIFISKEPLLPGEHLNVSIVYTPYKDCHKLRDRSYYRPNDSSVCVWEGFYCDGTRNCAFNMCEDEANCQQEIVSKGTGTKVTVGAVTTLFLSFLLLVVCLWICRKHKKLCWSTDCAGPGVRSSVAHSTDSQARDSNSSRVPVPSAPMLNEATGAHLQDKDLPPSYDSLFPDQTTPAGT